MVGSVRIAAAGGALLCTGVFALAVALPRITPFEVLHCVPPGETVCFSGVNPAYPAFFLLSIVGIVVFFLGAFGRGFVLNPVFVVGMIALAYGLSEVVSAALDKQRATPASPSIFLPLVVIGALAIWVQVYRRWLREDTDPARWRFYPGPRYHGMPKEIPKEVPPELYEAYEDPKRAMFFLPPHGCRNCGD